MFRRAVCNIPTNSLNKTFATLYEELDKTNYLNSFKYILINLDTYKVFQVIPCFMSILYLKICIIPEQECIYYQS